MKNSDYNFLEFKSIDSEAIDDIISIISSNTDVKYYINVKNTKYIDENVLNQLLKYKNIYIRIEGGYDLERLRNYSYPPYIDIHKFDNIYTVSETQNIIKELKKIESGLFYNWSDEQKLLYFISVIQDKIIYHPNKEKEYSNQIRSLRGLITRKTVCAGYALILKELCDRNNIECDYVEGNCDIENHKKNYLTHAWNIVKIQNNYFPVDLTFNAHDHALGDIKYIGYLFNATDFIQDHIPGKYEKIQDYSKWLKSMDGKFIRRILTKMDQNKIFDVTSFVGERNDSSKYLISQVGDTIIDGRIVYKYIYCDLIDNKIKGVPIVLYSLDNIAYFKCLEQKGEFTTKNYNYYLTNILLSKKNITSSLKRKDNFVGNIKIDSKSDVANNILIDLDISFYTKKFNSKSFQRSNGTNFLLESVENYPKYINGHKVYCYSMYEYVWEDEKIVLKANQIFTDLDIMKMEDKELADVFLSRDRIDYKVRKAGGYLGKYTKHGIRRYDTKIEELFSLAKRIEIEQKNIIKFYSKLNIDELKKLLLSFCVKRDRNNQLHVYDFNGNKIDKYETIIKVKYAYLWRKVLDEDKIISELYETINDIIESGLSISGNIRPIKILSIIDKKFNSNPIVFKFIVNLFKNDENNQIINDYYRMVNPTALQQTQKTDILVDQETAKVKLARYNKKLQTIINGLLQVKEENNNVVIKKYK